MLQQLFERPKWQCLKLLADYTLNSSISWQVRSASNRPPSSKQMEDRSGGKKSFKTTKVPYSSWKISCRLSLSFSSVFPSNAFQNIHKHNTIFLTQQHFVLWFVFLRNTWFNFCIPLWFRYQVWFTVTQVYVINMKIFFHVWNLIGFQRQKYNWGSLAWFIFVS